MSAFWGGIDWEGVKKAGVWGARNGHLDMNGDYMEI